MPASEKVWVGVRLKPVHAPCWACIEPGLLQLADGQVGSHLYNFDRCLTA